MMHGPIHILMWLLFLQIFWFVGFTRPSFRHTPASFFSIFYLSNHCNFFFDAQNLLLMTVAMLSLYQSPINCRSRKVEGNFNTRWITITIFNFKAWNLYRVSYDLDSLPTQSKGDCWIFRLAFFLKNYVATDNWQCPYVRRGCSYVCRTKWGRKTHALWEISWHHWMYDVIAEVLYKPRSSWPSFRCAYGKSEMSL